MRGSAVRSAKVPPWGVAASFVLTAFLGAHASAQTLLGAEFTGSQLYQVESSDGSSASKPGVDVWVSGLAHDPTTGTTHLLQGTQTGVGAPGLYTLDPSSSSTTFVGSLGASVDLTGLALSPDASSLFSIGGGDLYRIDPSAGSASLVGSLGGTAAPSVLDLTFTSDGTLLGMGLDSDLYAIDTATGAATLLHHVDELDAVLGATAIASVFGPEIFAIATLGDQLFRIDLSTGTATLVGGDIGSDVRGLTFIPEPGPAPLVAAGLIGLGVRRRFRRMARRYGRRSAGSSGHE